MSTIGRIFIVLNLILAGVFVGFASTYLQQAADYKAKYEQEQADRAADVERLNDQLKVATNEKSRIEGLLLQSQSNLSRQETRNSELADENQRLDAQLSQLDAAMQSMKSSMSAVNSSIERATSSSENALNQALAAQAERDAAVRAKDVAEADLADARNMITSLEETVAEREAALVAAGDKIDEQDIIIGNIVRNWPGVNVPALAMPDLKGTVQHVAGRLVTITVTQNPTESEIKPGYRFAIAGGDSYKGEAFVKEVDGQTAFCTMTILKDGASVKVGDAAMTHTH